MRFIDSLPDGICCRCNYNTYIVHAIPTLKILDRLRLAPDAPKVAAQTFARKQASELRSFGGTL